MAHDTQTAQARLAQPVERKALNLVVVGSSPTVGVTTAAPLGRWGCCAGVPAGCWRLLRPAGGHSRARVLGLAWHARVGRPCRGPGAPHASHQLRPNAPVPGWPAPWKGPAARHPARARVRLPRHEARLPGTGSRRPAEISMPGLAGRARDHQHCGCDGAPLQTAGAGGAWLPSHHAFREHWRVTHKLHKPA